MNVNELIGRFMSVYIAYLGARRRRGGTLTAAALYNSYCKHTRKQTRVVTETRD